MGETEEKRSCQRPRRWLLTGVLWVVAAVSAYAQQVRVNHLTGSPVFSVPLWQVVSGDISHPVVLSYQRNGLPAGLPAGKVGVGWQLIAGGTINRLVRGLPDDVESATHKGWLSSRVAAAVQDFSPSGGPDYSQAPDEAADYEALAAFGGFGDGGVIRDTEPDIFYLNVPGLQGRIVFDSEGRAVSIPYMDVRIKTERSAGTKRIQAFEISTAGGLTYRFDLFTTTRVQTQSHDEEAIPFNRADYYAYKAGLTWNSTWYLTSITSQEGSCLTFEYYKPRIDVQESPYQVIDYSPDYTDSLFTWHYSPQEDTYKKHSFYIKEYTVEQPYALRGIKGDNQQVRIRSGLRSLPLVFRPHKDWRMRPFDLRQPLVYTVEIYETLGGVKNLVRQYFFDYRYYLSKGLRPAGTTPVYYPFLVSVKEATAFRVRTGYRFEYLGLNEADSTTMLPHRSDNTRDYFGYSNAGFPGHKQSELQELYIYPSLPEAERYRHTAIPGYRGEFYYLPGRRNGPGLRGLEAGMLHRIHYPGAGSTTIFYEPNNYYDSLAGRDVYGGGLRVRELVVHDGQEHGRDMRSLYIYKNDQGHSSGVLTRYPQYAFNIGVFFNPDDSTLHTHAQLDSLDEEQRWQRTVIRTRQDQHFDPLSSKPYVMYSCVKQVTPGRGYVLYGYRTGLPYGREQASDWQVVQNRLARSPVAGTYLLPGYLRYRFGYPYSSQTNYNYREGLLLYREVYSEGDTLLSRTRTTYRYDYGPVIRALRKDKVPVAYVSGNSGLQQRDMYLYNLYEIRPATRTLTDSVISEVYNPQGYDTAMVTITHQSYSLPEEGYYPVRQTTLAPDGTRYTSYIRYNHDYGTVSDTTDTASYALYRMRANGLRGVVVERINTRTPPGGSEQLIAASLYTYQYLPGNRLRPLCSYTLRQGVPFAYDAAVFDSRIDAAGKFVFDERYEWLSRPVLFDDYGNVITTGSYDRHYSTVLYGYGGRIALLQAEGVRADGLLYSSFENQAGVDIRPEKRDMLGAGTDPERLQPGRAGGTALELWPGMTSLQQQVRKPAWAGRYILSFWLNTTGPVTITAVLDDGSRQEPVSISSRPGGGLWQYYEQVVETGHLGSLITLSLTTSDTVLIDDMLFYPQTAAISYTSYATNGLKTAVTNDRGQSEYYEYNAGNELEIIRDYEQRIVQRITRGPYATDTFRQPVISYTGELAVGRAHLFRLLNTGAVAGATFSWDMVRARDYPGGVEAAGYDFDRPGVKTVTGDNSVWLTPYDDSDMIVLARVTYQGASYYAQVLIPAADIADKQYLYQVCSAGPLRVDLCGRETGLYSECSQLPTGPGTAFYVEVSGVDPPGFDVIKWYKTNDPQALNSPGNFVVGSYSRAELIGTGQRVTIQDYDERNMYIFCALFKNVNGYDQLVSVSDQVEAIYIFSSCTGESGNEPGNPIE